MIKIFKNPFIAGLGIIVVGLSAVGYFYFFNFKTPKYEFTAVRRGNIAETVNVNGTIKPMTNVDLAFEKSGRVDGVNAAVGDQVKAGEILVSLNSADSRAELAQAEAVLQGAQAKLSEMKAGPTTEETAVEKAALAGAEQDLTSDYGNIANTVRDGYLKADDAVRIETAGLFQVNGPAYLLTFNSCDNQAAIDAEYLRQVSEAELINWQKETDSLNTSSSPQDLENYLSEAGGHLFLFKEFLDRTYANLVTSCLITNSSFDAYRTSINGAQTAIIGAADAVNNLKDKIASDKTAVNKSQQSLNKLLAGARPEEIAVQEAAVKGAEAKVENAKTQLADDFLYSPMAGVVSRQDAKIGEIVSPNSALVSIISSSKFKIETYIPDADVAKIHAGEPAKITLDAYGSEVVFDARVINVDPAETMQNNSPVYKTTLQFINEDERPKSGMTANIDIVAAAKENVLLIPQRAVIQKDGSDFVLLDAGGGKASERQIGTGIRGADGNVEVVSGLQEGDKIVSFGGIQ